MIKQEEVREGIEEILKDHFFPYTSATEEIIEYLHSQGVVIKVDRELPKRTWYKDWGGESGEDSYKLALEDMAGYVAVEPLIKEQKNEM